MRKFQNILWLWALLWVFVMNSWAGQSRDSLSKPVEVVLGKEGALTVIEYGSLSCGGCAYFAKEILPAIEKEYVETGKIRLIIRQMVMTDNDVKASMLVCCSPEPHKLQLAYWQKQGVWAGADDDQPIRKIARDHGMTDKQIQSCLADKHLRQTLYTKKFVALKGYNIQAIPTIFINNKEYPDIQDLKDFRKVIEQALKEAHNKTDK